MPQQAAESPLLPSTTAPPRAWWRRVRPGRAALPPPSEPSPGGDARLRTEMPVSAGLILIPGCGFTPRQQVPAVVVLLLLCETERTTRVRGRPGLGVPGQKMTRGMECYMRELDAELSVVKYPKGQVLVRRRKHKALHYFRWVKLGWSNTDMNTRHTEVNSISFRYIWVARLLDD